MLAARRDRVRKMRGPRCLKTLRVVGRVVLALRLTPERLTAHLGVLQPLRLEIPSRARAVVVALVGEPRQERAVLGLGAFREHDLLVQHVLVPERPRVSKEVDPLEGPRAAPVFVGDRQPVEVFGERPRERPLDLVVGVDDEVVVGHPPGALKDLVSVRGEVLPGTVEDHAGIPASSFWITALVSSVLPLSLMQ